MRLREIEPARRDAFLDEVCARDASLRAELLELLSGDGSDDATLARGAVSPRAGIPSELSLGRVLGGRFVIEKHLGAGGMGVVYEAFDRERRAPVALKTLTRVDADGIYRLKSEFRALADVVHANLVRLYELVAEEALWFLTMELVRGRSFRDYVNEPAAGRFDEPRLRAGLSQLAQGLAAVHDARKLHLDLKPSNVMVTDTERVVILDFGLARDVRGGAIDVTDVDLISGTPAYMAPEQVSLANAGPASDWYAVGVMLYEALTGSLPFTGSALDVLSAKRARDPEPPSRRANGVPRDLDELCMQLMARDPGARPSARDVLATLHLPSPVTPAAVKPQFVGRERELSVLRGLFTDVAHGKPRVAFVTGPSGIGKSALVQRFLEELRSGGNVLVLEGRCYEREALPYKGFDAVADALSRYLARLGAEEAAALLPRDVLALTRLFPALERVPAVARASGRALVPDPVELRRRALAALKELLARTSDREPLVICVDDLQWTDRDSATLLRYLLSPPEPPTMLLVGSYRAEEESRQEGLRDLLEPMELGLEAVTIDLSPLSEADASALARRLLGDRSDARDVAAKIARESQGSPFFLEALALHSSRTRDSVADFGTMIEERMAGLGAEAKRMLELVCVSAGPSAQATICAAAGAEARPEAFDELRAGRFVRTAGSGGRDPISAYHDRIRELVVRKLGPDRLREHHAALARALQEDAGSDAETLATHFRGAGALSRAARYSETAAAQALQAMAFDRAARLFRTALELVKHDREKERAMQRQLGDALKNAGRSAEAAEVYRRAAEGAERRGALELRRLSAERLLVCGRIDEGYEAITGLLSELGVRVPRTKAGTITSLLMRRARIRIREKSFREREAPAIDQLDLLRIDTCASVVSGLTWVDALRGASLQALHLLLALRAGERGRVARAYTQELLFRSMEGGRASRRTARLLELTRALVESVDSPDASGLLELNEGGVCYLQGRFREGARHLARAEDTLRRKCVGLVWELTNARLFWLLCLYFLGRIGAILDRLPEILEEALALDDRFAATVLRTRFAHVAWLARDDPDRALEEVRDAIARWSHRGFHTEHGFALIGEVESLLYAGRGAEAMAFVTDRWPELAHSGVLGVIQLARIECHHLRARAALAAVAKPAARERERLLGVARRDAKRIASERMPWSTPLALLLEAGIAAAAGSRDEARARLEGAESGFREADLGLYASAAQRRRGELLGGDEGAAMVAAADESMTAERIRDPARFAAMLAPGFA